MAHGSRGSSAYLLAGVIAHRTRRPVVLVVAHLDEADDALDDLTVFTEAGHALSTDRFGALEVLPGESSVSLELLAERLNVVGRLASGDHPDVLVAPIQALMQTVPDPGAMGAFSRLLGEGDVAAPGELAQWLTEAGYQRQDAIEQPGDFAVRGGIVDIYPPAGRITAHHGGREPIAPIRLDFFGDEIDTLHIIDTDTMGSGMKLASVQLVGASADHLQADEHTTSLLSLLPSDAILILHEPLELSEQARGYFERLTDPRGIISPRALLERIQQQVHVEINQYSAPRDRSEAIEFPVSQLPPFDTDAAKAVWEVGELANDAANQVVVLCEKQAERERLGELVAEHAPEAAEAVQLEVGYLHRGFQFEANANSEAENAKLLLIPHHELFHRYDLPASRRRVRQVAAGVAEQGTGAFLDLDVGDYVVHVDHGIARFTGLRTMRRDGVSQEFLTLEFAEQRKLHVPATQIDLVQKYIGGFEGRPPLSKLGGKRWNKQKDQVRRGGQRPGQASASGAGRPRHAAGHSLSQRHRLAA